MSNLYLRLLVALLFGLGFTNNSIASEISGTGFLVSADGWVLTNAHVVENCTSVEIYGKGTSLDIKRDNANDLALIKIQVKDTMTPLKFRHKLVRLGEDILALGYPLDGLLSDTIKMTTGNVSSLSGIQNDTRFIQISTPIQPGNSGGPIIDREGNIIGIATSVLAKDIADEMGFTAQNVNFAIRATVADLFLQSQGIEAQYSDMMQQSASLHSTADLAEKVAPSIYKIICQPKEQMTNMAKKLPPQPEPQSIRIEKNNDNEDSLISQNNYDAIGFDYDLIKNTSYSQCVSICENDYKCAAITWNKRFGSCMLKNDIAILIKNNNAISAYASYKQKDIIFSDFSAFSGFDIVGNDYARIRQSDYTSCFIECMKDTQCKAFAYVAKKKECWLKDKLGEMKSNKAIELGIK